MDNELLVKSIKAACKKRNLSVSQLEKKLNFSSSLISRWNKTSPSLDKIVDIADYLDISIDELIGREINVKSKTAETFIDVLYNMTKNSTLIWDEESSLVPDLIEKEHIEDDGYEYYQLYISDYNNGTIYLYTQYDKEKGIINDIDIQLYIQPDKLSELVIQECDDTKLYNLWYYIQAKFYGKLDEIKAEEFKNNFINTPETLSNEKIEKFLEDPSITKLIETVDIKEFQKVQQIFDNPEFKSALQMLNSIQNYLDNKK